MLEKILVLMKYMHIYYGLNVSWLDLPYFKLIKKVKDRTNVAKC